MIKVSFEELEEKLKVEDGSIVLVKFGAPWCAPCKVYEPVLHSYAEAHPEYLVLEIDIDEDIDAAKKYGVHGLPTTIVFVNGSEKKRKVGSLSAKALDELLVV